MPRLRGMVVQCVVGQVALDPDLSEMPRLPGGVVLRRALMCTTGNFFD